jgi:lysozyme family protein
MAPTFSAIAGEYARLWQDMTINQSRVQGFAATGKRILKRCPRYVGVSLDTGVPVAVIAVIHERESAGDFATHLHNGDKLSARTVHVPKGRPRSGSPPFTWEESAIDALRYQQLHTIVDWSLERALYVLEAYNGWGYRNKGMTSPYLWGGTNQQMAGKYVADGVFNATVMDTQPGCAPLLYTLFGLDRTLALRLSGEPTLPEVLPEPVIPPPRRVPPKPEPEPEPPPTPFPSPAQQGGIVAVIAALIGGFLFAGQQVADWFRSLFGG